MLDVSRKEKKYLLSTTQSRLLQGRLKNLIERDSHSKVDGYTVRSLYFDSMYDTDFEEKVDGYDDRKKIRLRIYDAKDESAKLEIKEKSGDSQRKRSLNLSREEGAAMVKGSYSFLLKRPEPLAKWLYAYMTTHGYRPKCIVQS